MLIKLTCTAIYVAPFPPAGLLLISTFKDLIFGWRNWFLYLRQTMRNPDLLKKELEKKAARERARSAAGETGASQSSVAGSNVYTIEASDPFRAMLEVNASSPSVNAVQINTEETTLSSTFKLSNAPKQTRDVAVQSEKRGFRIEDLNRYGGPRKKKSSAAPGASSSDNNSNSSSAAAAVGASVVEVNSQPPEAFDALGLVDTQLSSVSTFASVSSNATANNASRAEVTIEQQLPNSDGFANPAFALDSRRPQSGALQRSSDASAPAAASSSSSSLPPSYNSFTRSTIQTDGGRREPSSEPQPLSEWRAAMLMDATLAAPPTTPSGTRPSNTIVAPSQHSSSTSSRDAASIEMTSGATSPVASVLRQRSSLHD